MAKEDLMELDGIITDIQKERFVISTDRGSVLGYLSGKIKINNIRLVLGDRVVVEVSVYDVTKGRITYRYPTSK